MAQSNLAKEFVRIRGILDEGDFKTILKNLFSLQVLFTTINRYMEKFIKTGENTLDICAGDIKDLCDLTAPLLAKYEKKINHNTMYKDLWDCDILNDEHFREWSIQYTNLFSVVAKLRCFLSVMSYAYCMLDAYEKQWNQNNDLTTVIANTIKNYIRYEY